MEKRILRRDEVERVTGLARSTIYERMKRGQFPTAIRLGGRSVGWYQHEIQAEIQAWEDEQAAGRAGTQRDPA